MCYILQSFLFSYSVYKVVKAGISSVNFEKKSAVTGVVYKLMFEILSVRLSM